jgi:uncharacterized protein (DUF1778 family)
MTMPTLCKERPPAARTPSPARKATSFRLPEPTLELLDQARARTHQDRTDFTNSAIVEKAKEVLRDQTVFTLSPEDYERFIAALDNPPPPNEFLIELVHEKPLWERG